uniref:Uncharacterized protein n=1 Tax=Arion vulgaris TaxID=1028688 RepID=A0A0B6ZR86_9EUPU
MWCVKQADVTSKVVTHTHSCVDDTSRVDKQTDSTSEQSLNITIITMKCLPL